ncbi:hypothetical protein, partial [Pantoea sp. GbtcB22]|uniref:hypothetical protein n=1 Tax=Pantoea sp. GbtcB22 TaxID=2824767 RepID=UPI001C2FBDD4
ERDDEHSKAMAAMADKLLKASWALKAELDDGQTTVDVNPHDDQVLQQLGYMSAPTQAEAQEELYNLPSLVRTTARHPF